MTPTQRKTLEDYGTVYSWELRRNHNRVALMDTKPGKVKTTVREAIDAYKANPEWGR